MKALTLYSESYVCSEWLSCHLIGRCTAVDGVVIRWLDGEYQLVLSSSTAAHVRKVELGTIAVPVDLS